MKKIIPIFVLFIMAALISVSCKSAPAPMLEELNDSRLQAQASRQRAIDFESPAYFESEWEAAEILYNASEVPPKANKDEVEKLTDRNNTVKGLYDMLFRRSVPLYAQAKEDEILSARETLINSGFADYFPEYVKNADDIALAAHEQYEAQNYYGAKATAAKAMNEYETLLKGANVLLARQEIIDRGFAKYDEQNFLKGDELADSAVSEWDAGNREAAIKKAEEALEHYNLVLKNGWTTYSAERREMASKERELAIAEKANIASRDLFREGEFNYIAAQENFAEGNFHDAGNHFTDAEALYSIARKDTEEKRLKAEEAIKMAEERIDESNEAAIEAERIIEGGLR